MQVIDEEIYEEGSFLNSLVGDINLNDRDGRPGDQRHMEANVDAHQDEGKGHIGQKDAG